MATKAKAKKEAQTVELTESFNKIKETAKNINMQVVETAVDVFDDVLENGKKWRTDMTENAKEVMENINLSKGVDAIKSTAKNVNNYSLEVADNLVDGALENGQKWQKVADKAVKGGLKLAEKQQDIIFDTLETVKGQLINSAERFRGLFNQN